MNRPIAILVLAMTVSACDVVCRMPQPEVSAAEPVPTYSGCLMKAMGSGNPLSADDIRALCAEATNVVAPRYEHSDDKVEPSNAFTKCYDEERRKYEVKGLVDATRLAKLSCKYPDVR
jgi:hypothetical protein